MELAQLIAHRRSVFPVQYNSEAISKSEIETLLQAANWAPTHRRTEPWRFKVFHSEASRKGLSDFLARTFEATAEKFSKIKQKKIAEKPVQSACVIAICMQRDPNESVPEWEEVAATAMAVQNMWLLATAMGIGTYWSSPGLRNHLNAHVTMAEGEQCLGFFYMGKYDGPLEEGTRHTAIEKKTTWY
ncbi:nitroreductase family protein [Altibacter sp. HG106]|uniref:nitroreductase family protein n=1 Tax=Altibacter sp. HG106 TaxID=3023937 RepID=UPI002350C35D|nr:nitroreductase [Altibacter sp. HG106]MDC7994059.1 nitroreductase [Altibacter sp. HG106]